MHIQTPRHPLGRNLLMAFLRRLHEPSRSNLLLLGLLENNCGSRKMKELRSSRMFTHKSSKYVEKLQEIVTMQERKLLLTCPIYIRRSWVSSMSSCKNFKNKRSAFCVLEPKGTRVFGAIARTLKDEKC